jgi:hypothetical protein
MREWKESPRVGASGPALNATVYFSRSRRTRALSTHNQETERRYITNSSIRLHKWETERKMWIKIKRNTLPKLHKGNEKNVMATHSGSPPMFTEPMNGVCTPAFWERKATIIVYGKRQEE